MKKSIQKHLTDRAKAQRAPTQFEVAVIAVYMLGGASRSIDTEDVAIKCHELAPTLFSWQKHKDQINLELVRVNLSNAKKTQNGSLLSGSGREGWRLNSRGVDWITSTGQALIRYFKGKSIQTESKAGSIDAVRKQRERARLIASDAWHAWSSGGPLSVFQARQVFRIDEYATSKMLEIKIARLRAMFEGNAEMSRFLEVAGRLVMEDEQHE